MKRLIILVVIMFSTTLYAQINGIKTIPGNYPTIALAISNLNAQGVGAGGVTFNIAAGYTETFASSTAGLITATGTATTPIVFQKDGTGANPLITAATGTSTDVDGIIVITGGDYITFNGIDLIENPANINQTQQMEWGYALLKESGTNGSQYNSISNCAITLNKTNLNSVGIYSGNHLNTNKNIIYVSSFTGTNSNNKINGNTINNVYSGIYLEGFSDPNMHVFYDQNNEIGFTSGNSITNFAGGIQSSAGIYLINNNAAKIANNAISSSGIRANIRGIYLAPTFNVSIDVTGNTISLSGIAETNTTLGIESAIKGTTDTVNIRNNTIQNCTNTSATLGSFCGVLNSDSSHTLNIINNQVINNLLSGLGTFTGIDGGYCTILNLNNNTVSGNRKTNAPGIMYCVKAGTATITCNHNFIDDNTLTMVDGVFPYSSYGETSSILYGYYNYGIPLQQIYENNTVSNIMISGGVSNYGNSIYGFKWDNMAPNSFLKFSNNLLHDFKYINTLSSFATIYGIEVNHLTATFQILNNKIYRLEAQGKGSLVRGMGISFTGSTCNIYNNFISELYAPASNGIDAILGLSFGGSIATTNTVNLFNNTIYLSAASTGENFSTSCIYASIPINIKNNIIINKSIAGPSGFTAAYKGTSGIISNHSSTSNNNCMYVDPGSGHNCILFFDLNNLYYSISDFQTFMNPSESLSFSEDVHFVNTLTSPFDLHVNTTVPSLCEGRAMPISSPIVLNEDIDGDARGLTSDVGADEFSGTPIGVHFPQSFSAKSVNSQENKLAFTTNQSNNNIVIVWNNTGVFSSPSGTPPLVIGSVFAGGKLLYNGSGTNISHTGLTNATTYYYKAFSYDGVNYSNGLSDSVKTMVSPPQLITANAISSSQINLAWTKNIYNDNVLIAQNTADTFGIPVNGSILALNSSIPNGGGLVIYSGPLSSFNNTGLLNGTQYYYKIWSVDPFNFYSSTGLIDSATTFNCSSFSSFPLMESFDDTLNFPSCWTNKQTAGTGTTSRWSIVSLGVNQNCIPQSGNGMIKFSSYNNYIGVKAILATPPLTIPTDSYQVSFWIFRDNHFVVNDQVNIYCNSEPNTNGAVLLGSVNRVISKSPVESIDSLWYQYSFNLPSGSVGNNRFIIFEGVSASGYNIFIDDIKVEPQPLCSVPDSLIISNVSNTQATIGWATGGSESAWNIEYGSLGFVPGTGTIISASSNPFTLTGLTPNSDYTIYVQANCGGSSGVGGWSHPSVFSTPCTEISAFPYLESFDGSVFPPICWENHSVLYPLNGFSWERATSQINPTCTPHSDTVMAMFNCYNYPAGNKALFITPKFNFPTDNYQFKFWMYRDNGQPAKPDLLNVYYNATPDLLGATLLGTLNRNNTLAPIEAIPNRWYPYSYNVPEATNSGYFIFEAVSAYGYNIYIDDVSVGVQPACSKPNSLASTNISSSESLLSWNASGSENSWNIEYGEIGFLQGTGTMTTTSSTHYTATGLNPNLTYSFYVQADCGGTSDTSTWAGPFPFSTSCAPVSTFPFNESFDGTTFAPSCWQNFQTVGSGTPRIWVRSTGETYLGCAPHSGTGMAKYYTTTSGSALLILPPINFPSDLYQVNFWMFREYTSWLYDDKVNVYYNSAPSTTNAVLLGTVHRNTYSYPLEQSSFRWYHYTFDLPEGCAGNNRYIIFESVSASSNKLLIDDIQVDVQSNCASPSNPSTTIISSSEVSLDWNAGGSETEWKIQYDTAGFTLGLGTIDTAYSKPFNLTGLSPNKTYSYYIQANCGGLDGSSSWIGPYEFTTPCDVAISTYPYLEGFESTTFAPTCWTNRQSSGYENSKIWSLSSNGLPSYAHGGSRKAIYNCFNYSVNDKAELASPPLNLPSDQFRVRFWMYRDNSYLQAQDSLNVYYNTIPNKSGGTLLGTIHRNSSLSPVEQTENSWYRYTYNLPIGSSGSNRYIILEAVSQKGNDIAIDDFSIEAQSAYPSPTNITVTSITPTGATLNWTPGGTETAWNIEYGPTGFTQGTGTAVSTTTSPYIITSLNQGTSYSVYIQADYGGAKGVSEWVGPINFTTLCETISTFPFAESFDNVTFPSACWLNIQVFGSNPAYKWNRVTSGISPTCNTHSGVGMTTFQCSSSPAGLASILVTPALSFPSDNYQVSFWMYRDNESINFADSVNIYYNVNPDKTGAILLGSVHRNNQLSPCEQVANNWYQYSFNMPPGSAGQSSYVIFEAVSKKGKQIYIDDITIDVQPPCPAPSSLTVNTITATSATIGWTSHGDESSWNIEYGAPGFTLGTGTSITVNTDPYVLTGLIQNRSYSFYVQANCGTLDGNSSWVGPMTFSIPCQTISSFPFMESFDDTTFAPTCWTNIGSNGVSTSYLWDRSATGIHPICLPHSGGGMARYNCYDYYSGASAILTTPALNLNSDFYKVSFWMYRDNERTNLNDYLEVYFNSTPNLTGATLLGKIYRIYSNAPATQTPNQWYQYSFNFPPNSNGTNKYAIFKAVSASGNSIYIDDIKVELSECVKPKNIYVTDNTASSVILNWTNGGNETAWVLEYGPEGFAQGSGTTIPITTRPYTLTGLTSGTNYSFYLRADCGSTIGTSEWSGPYTFHTLCPSVSSISLISNTTSSALLGWTNGGVEMEWEIEYGPDGFLQGSGTYITATSNPYNISGLLPGTTYSAYVRAVCSNDSTMLSSLWGGPSEFSTVCPSVLSVVSTSITQNSVILNWIPSGNETAWNLQYKKVTDATYTTISNTSIIPYTLLGLESNTAYVWSVQAICGNLTTSDWSADDVFNTAVGISENAIDGMIVYSYNNMINIRNQKNIWIDEIVLYDLLGKEVAKYNINSADNVLINTNFSTTNYILKILTKNVVGTTKLFLQN